MPPLTAIIPVFNERHALAATLSEWLPVLRQVDSEIIIIDDGSTDGTLDSIAAFDGLRVISHGHNRGYGAAFKTALGHSTSDLIITLDADGTYPAAAFAEMWRARHADTVIGARRTEPDLLKRVAKNVVFAFAGLVANNQIPDLNTGLRIVRTDLARRWAPSLPDGFSATTTMTMAALLERRTIAWVPIDYRPRIGPSKFHPLKDTLRLTRQIVRSRSLFRP